MPNANNREDISRETVRGPWVRYLATIEPHRGALFRHCRYLARNVWDAEDLVQETMLRGFTHLALEDYDVSNWRAYLFRTATNLWIDQKRKSGRGPLDETLPASISDDTSRTTELREGGRTLFSRLAPQERAALVLKEGGGFTLEEISTMLTTTTGAVKSALHRARTRLGDPENEASANRPSEVLIDRFVAAFNAADFEELASLLLETATAEVFMLGTGRGREELQKPDRWLYACLYGHSGGPRTPQRAEKRLYLDEAIVVLWREEDGEEKLEEVWRFTECEGGIARIRDYCACPETIDEIASAFNAPCRTRSYRIYLGAPTG